MSFLVREGIVLGQKVSKSVLEVDKAKVEFIGCIVFLAMQVFTGDSSWIFPRLQDLCAFFGRRR